MGKVRDNIRGAQRVWSVGRKAAKGLREGERGCWDVELRVFGLSDERREELVEKMEAVTGRTRMPSRGDGGIGFSGQVDGFNLSVAITVAVNNFTTMFHRVELDPMELEDCETVLTVTPAADREPQPFETSLKGRAISKVGTFAFGLHTATEELRDYNSRFDTGDRHYMLVGALTDLADGKAEFANRWMDNSGIVREGRPDEAPEGEDGVAMAVAVSNVGSVFGAFIMYAARVKPVLQTINAGATLELACQAISSEDIPDLPDGDAAVQRATA